MIIQIRLILTAFFLSIILVACGDNDAPQAEKKRTTASVAMSDANIEQGMSKNAVMDLLGDPEVSQTQTIDALSMTHSEWADKTGTVSVQFINDKAQFILFTANEN